MGIVGIVGQGDVKQVCISQNYSGNTLSQKTEQELGLKSKIYSHHQIQKLDTIFRDSLYSETRHHIQTPQHI